MFFGRVWRGKRLLPVLFFMLCASAGCKQGPWTLWNAYSAHFIDPQGRVIDPQGDQRTTSEGQSYALFFALVDNDRPCFDRVLNWTQANMASGDLSTHLPSWLWGRSKTGQWTALDANSASDADAWIAYTLIEAGRLWNHPTYTHTGMAMLRLIAKNEVVNLPGFGPMMLPGPTGFQHGNAWTLNPSYLPMFLFQRLAVADPSGPWGEIAMGIPHVLEQSSRRGYAMDWVEYVPGDGFYPTSIERADGQPAGPPQGSYDAIRVYLWAGMMSKGPAQEEILNAVPGMRGYLANHDAPPEKVSDEGIPGEHDGPVGFSAALVPYLKAYPGLSALTAKQLVRMAREKDATTGLYGKDVTYYDQNLALFSTGYVTGRFKFGPEGELRVEWTRR